MNRRERQGAILRLIRDRELSTQSELAEALRSEGHEVTQTTVSRDIADLGLVKVRAPSGRLVYAAREAMDIDRLGDLHAALRRWALGVEHNESIVVIFTPRGFAVPLADAIDASHHPLVLATVAGENTILVVPRVGNTPKSVRDALSQHLLEGAA